MTRLAPLDGIRQSIIGTGPAKRLSVSNFALSICEIKGLYREMKVYAPLSEEQQLVLDRGKTFHSRLNVDAQPIELIPYPGRPPKPALRYAAELLNLIHRWTQVALGRSTREIPVFGKYKGIELHGMIDGLEAQRDCFRVVEDKTYSDHVDDYKLRLAFHQTLVYHYLYNQMKDPYFDVLHFVKRPEFDPSEQLADEETCELVAPWFTPDHTLNDVYKEVFIAWEEFRFAGAPLDESIIIRYSHINGLEEREYKFKFNQDLLDKVMKFRAGLWLGEREPIPQRLGDGVFSCKSCEYRNMCEFTRRQQRA